MKDKGKSLIVSSLALLCMIYNLCLGCSPKTSEEKKAFTKPNIIYILADDLGYGDLSCYGQQKYSTPHIDNLAETGIKFTQHYSGSTVCAPSRSSLLTGMHTGHTFIRGNKEYREEGQYPLADTVITIAEILKANGYTTGAFGKWGLGYPGSEGDPNHQGFDEFFGYNCQRLAHSYYPYHLWNNQTKIVLEENAGQQRGVYAPELIHQKALQFIEKNKDSVFFMYYPSVIPHAELAAPAEYMELFNGKFQEEKAFKGIDKGKRFRNGGYASQEYPRTAFAAMLTLLDNQVGEISRKLKELGISDNTIIIFSSDNGPHLEGGADPDFFNSNAGLRGYKRDFYEGGIRVPLIVYWPSKIKSELTTTHVSAFWDVLPTLCDIIGAETPNHTDGISFLPTLTEKPQQQHPYLYWEFLEKGGKQAVRFGNWKSVRLNMTNNKTAPLELYDLKTDQTEAKNVADKYPQIVDTITSIMNSEHTFSKEFQFEFEHTTQKQIR